MLSRNLMIVRLQEAAEQHPGMWVGIKDGAIVEVRRTPDEVVESLHRREITDTYVTRLPGEHDKELVGLG